MPKAECQMRCNRRRIGINYFVWSNVIHSSQCEELKIQLKCQTEEIQKQVEDKFVTALKQAIELKHSKLEEQFEICLDRERKVGQRKHRNKGIQATVKKSMDLHH